MTNPIGANRLLHVFGGEILQCEEIISHAFVELAQHSASPAPAAQPIHGLIRTILSEAALISLIFFPNGGPKKPSAERAEYLRSELEVDESSSLRSRVLRNHLVHLDERLDNWAMNSAKKTFGRGMLGSREDAQRVGLSNEDILGLFNPNTFAFSFLEDDLQVDDLVGEVRDISHKVRRLLRDLPWLEEAH